MGRNKLSKARLISWRIYMIGEGQSLIQTTEVSLNRNDNVLLIQVHVHNMMLFPVYLTCYASQDFELKL